MWLLDRHTHGQTEWQTDAGQSDPYVPLCFAGDTITHLQWISGDTSKNFVIAVIRYIDIAKFVIHVLYINEFVLHKGNKPGTMNRYWTLYIHIITWGSLSDNFESSWKGMGHSFFDRYRNFDLWILKWTFFKIVLKVFGGILNLLAISFFGNSPFCTIERKMKLNNSYFVSRVTAFFLPRFDHMLTLSVYTWGSHDCE